MSKTYLVIIIKGAFFWAYSGWDDQNNSSFSGLS